MKCPNCGAAELVSEVRDLPYVNKGEKTVLALVKLLKVLDRHPDLLAELRTV